MLGVISLLVDVPSPSEFVSELDNSGQLDDGAISPTHSPSQSQPTSTSRNVSSPAGDEAHASFLGSGTDGLGSGLQDKFSSVKLRDFVTHTVLQKRPSLPSPAAPDHDHPGTHFPIAHYVSCDQFTVK